MWSFTKRGETAEECYDRIKSYLEQIYRDFERYKDDYEEFKGHILNKLPRAISTERNEWDVRYNDEVITSALVTGYVRFLVGYIYLLMQKWIYVQLMIKEEDLDTIDAFK